MENNEMTYWKNYQIAMQWIKGNPIDYARETMEQEDKRENDELEFEIDEDLLDFYRLSKEHKTNRKTKKSQEKNESERVELIPGEQIRPHVQAISKLPPINRAKLRQLELEWLYGKNNSSKIQARETQFQMEFDQIFDKKQPSYFPSLPNRLQLDPNLYGKRSCIPTISILDTTTSNV